MLYIIGGAPRMGKSHFAKQLAQKHSAQLIELDVLMPAFNALIPEEEKTASLPVWAKIKAKECPTVDDYIHESFTYWPAIEGMLSFIVEKRSDDTFIVEGAQLNPEKLSHWTTSLDKGVVSVTFLYDEDVDFIINQHPNVREAANEEHRILAIKLLQERAQINLLLGKELKRRAEENGFAVLNREEAKAQL